MKHYASGFRDILKRAFVIAVATGMIITSAVSCDAEDKSDNQNKSYFNDVNTEQSLKDFLVRFVSRYPVSPDGSWEYNCLTAGEGNNILACIATPASCADWGLYSDIPQEDCFVEKSDDPRGWAKETHAYYVYDAKTVEFIAGEIFNVSADNINRLKKDGEKSGLFYVENGRYYTLFEGIPDSYSDINLISVTLEKNRYTVEFNVNGVVNKDENDELTLIRGKCGAELELKTIGDSEYWSLYRFY